MTEKKDTTIAIAIIVAALLIGGSILFAGNNVSSALSKLTFGTVAAPSTGGSGSPADEGNGAGDDEILRAEIDVEGLAFQGSEDAEVVIVEFSEFQCPFCRRHYNDAYAQIKTEYIDTGKVKYYFKHFPLRSIHPGAQVAGEASECAGEQGLFWEMHDIMFEKQNELRPDGGTVAFSAEDVKEWAAEVEGLDPEAFDACIDSAAKAGIVEEHFQEGVGIGVSGTPTTFVNGRPIVGAMSFQTFQALIEEELAG